MWNNLGGASHWSCEAADLRHCLADIEQQAAHLVQHGRLAAARMAQIQGGPCRPPPERQRQQPLLRHLRTAELEQAERSHLLQAWRDAEEGKALC